MKIYKDVSKIEKLNEICFALPIVLIVSMLLILLVQGYFVVMYSHIT